MENVNQKHYGQLEIDNSEKDMVQIWMHEKVKGGGTNSEVIHIERENLATLIKILTKCLKN